MAPPTIIAQLVNLLYNIVDRIYIGHIEGIGATALTGVGLCAPILMLVTAFAMLASAGGATYPGNQPESKQEKGWCFGLAANTDFILVCTYEENGENPELVVYKKKYPHS